MAKTKKMDARRRQRDAQDKGLHAVARTPAVATKTKADLRRAFVASKAAEVVARNLADDSGARARARRARWRRQGTPSHTRAPAVRVFADADEPAAAAHAIEAFDSLASELLSIPVAARKRPAPPPPAQPAAPSLVLRIDATDCDGDIDLTKADAHKAKAPKRAKAGEKKAKRKLQRARAKVHKKKRTTTGGHKKAPRR